MDLDPVKAGVTLNAPVEHAFKTFVERIGDWWPRAYTFSQDDLPDSHRRSGGRPLV
jgi:hypothetical protein